ncbi:MAG TPA: GNAT family N-acetyltransferase [Acidobacteriota bacterium]|nr:GNAT family N-acetyltransferase [Acidobacteriota bacterium]
MSNLNSKSGEFAFQYLETEDDIEQNLELMRQVFWQEGVDNFVKKLITHHPTMTLKDFLVIKHHGKIIAGLNLIPIEWSIGGILLRVAEMGCVATLAQYRHRDLQRWLINEFHKRATEQGYDLCAIEGIPYFYRQFGYEYALPLNQETKIGINQIPDYETKLNIRHFTDQDIPRAMQLLTQSHKKFYVHSVRNEKIWKMQQETGIASGDKFEGYALEKNGEMVAYIRIKSRPETKELILNEAVETHQRTDEAILRFLKDTAKQRGLESVNARISYHDPLANQLVTLGAVQRMPYAWQIRILDYAKIFQKMKSLLEKRLTSSASRHLSMKLSFNFYRYAVEITVEDGRITSINKSDGSEDRNIRVNPEVFTQLLLGHRSREELEAIYPDFIVQASHKGIVDTIFPKLPSHIHSAY